MITNGLYNMKNIKVRKMKNRNRKMQISCSLKIEKLLECILHEKNIEFCI